MSQATSQQDNVTNEQTLQKSTAYAAWSCVKFGGPPLKYEQLTSAGAVMQLTPPANATVCLIQTETKACRFRDDGVNPTGTVGYMIHPGLGGDFPYSGDLSAVRLIEDGATSTSVVNVLYY